MNGELWERIEAAHSEIDRLEMQPIKDQLSPEVVEIIKTRFSSKMGSIAQESSKRFNYRRPEVLSSVELQQYADWFLEQSVFIYEFMDLVAYAIKTGAQYPPVEIDIDAFAPAMYDLLVEDRDQDKLRDTLDLFDNKIKMMGKRVIDDACIDLPPFDLEKKMVYYRKSDQVDKTKFAKKINTPEYHQREFALLQEHFPNLTERKMNELANFDLMKLIDQKDNNLARAKAALVTITEFLQVGKQTGNVLHMAELISGEPEYARHLFEQTFEQQ